MASRGFQVPSAAAGMFWSDTSPSLEIIPATDPSQAVEESNAGSAPAPQGTVIL
jgi:hypothetical protein